MQAQAQAQAQAEQDEAALRLVQGCSNGMLRRDLGMGVCKSPKTWGESGRVLSLRPPKPPASNSLARPGSWNDAPLHGQPE